MSQSFTAVDTSTSYRAKLAARLIQPHTATTAELLAIALDIRPTVANRIIDQFKQNAALFGEAHLYERLRGASAGELQQVQGLTEKKLQAAIAILELAKRMYTATPALPIIDSPEKAADLFKYDLAYSPVEKFAVLVLDVKHQAIAVDVLTIGTSSETLAHPRDIFAATVRHNGSRLIVAHNHPSGHTVPSPEDLELTRQILKGGQMMGIPVLDHIILGKENFSSLRQTTGLWHELPQAD